MILAVLQARMSSVRLPAKVLAPVLGVPLILRAVERINFASMLDGLVLATSTDASDDELAEVASASGIRVARGSLTDVLGRFLDVVEEVRPAHVVRLTGDNALIDPRVIDKVVEAHLASGADYTSNTLKRTYPRGLDVEVVTSSALRTVGRLAVDGPEREHVTMGIYHRPRSFSLRSVTQVPDRSEWRWTVDLPGDLSFVRAVYAELYAEGARFGQEEIVELLRRRPELVRTEADAERSGGAHVS